MTKTITIEGMTCAHCKASVEKALGAIPGVSAAVDLAQKTARVSLNGEMPDAALAQAVEDAGYRVLRVD